MDRQTLQTDGQTDRHTYTQTDRHTDRNTYRQKQTLMSDKQTDSQTDKRPYYLWLHLLLGLAEEGLELVAVELATFTSRPTYNINLSNHL